MGIFYMVLATGMPCAATAQQQADPPAGDVRFKKFDDAIKDMGKEVHRFVTNRQDAGSSIRISSFEGPNGTSSGANVVRILRDELTALGVTVNDTAGFKVSGKLSSLPESGLMVTLLQAEIANSFNTTELALRKRIVTDTATALAFLATTADLSRAATNAASSDKNKAASSDPKPVAEVALTNREATAKVLESVAQPKAEVVKEQVQQAAPGGQESVVHEFLQVDADSPYGLEVLKAGANGRFLPCEITLESTGTGGKVGFISLDPADVFKVRIRNASKRSVGCDLRLDGINVFAFSDYRPWRELGKMNVLPGGGEVAGWHKGDDLSLAFKITAYGDSAAGQLGVTEGLGAITAIFYEMHDSPLQGEPPADAIGFGPDTRVHYQSVAAYFGNPVGTVTIRYRRTAPPTDLPPGE